jgi:hypothetical protein
LIEGIPGFWLPKKIRKQITDLSKLETLTLKQGLPCDIETPGAVTTWWPILTSEQWQELIRGLHAAKANVPHGESFWQRLQEAIRKLSVRLSDPSDSLHQRAVQSLPTYTGYSEAMIRVTLESLDFMSLELLPAAFSLELTPSIHTTWQPMRDLPGRLRFFYHSRRWFSLPRLWSRTQAPYRKQARSPELVVGYGAGNVPGTALLIAFLSQAVTLIGSHAPAVVVKNSRREPIFTPLILEGIEDIDPDLVSSVAVLIWDYEDQRVQELLLSQAELVIAAASDETIQEIQRQLTHIPLKVEGQKKKRRFHPHGHKVSFSAIGKEVLGKSLVDDKTRQSYLDIVTFMSALDSIFWDQQGCLSSRVHFVESGGGDVHSAQTYAKKLEEKLKLLSMVLPIGSWPRQRLYDRFDKYKLLETSGLVRVLSGYEDDFVVVIDERPLSAAAFQAGVNDCMGRVVIVRPVTNLLDVPNSYLRMLPRSNLQSMSVAVGKVGDTLSSHFLEFASACAQCGITGIRTVGRAAFPQLSHSWDGWIPLDLVRDRVDGYFSSIEFDRPMDEILHTYSMLMQRGATVQLSDL